MRKNLFYTILLSIVNILFPILSFPYASHILGPVGIGKVQFIFSFAQYFALFAALGIPIYGIKETAKYKDDPDKLASVFTELTTIFFVSSLLLYAVYLIVIFSFPFFILGRPLYLIAGMMILLSFFNTDWFYSGVEEFRGITLRSVLIKTISLILLYTLVKTEEDFKYYLFITLFSVLGNQALSFLLVFRKLKFHFLHLDFKKHLEPMFYIFGASIASSIYLILDTVLLGFLSNDKAVGLYTAAVKLIKITIPIVTSMGLILIPAISKNFAQDRMDEVRKLLDRSFNFIVVLSIPICIGLSILAPEFIVIFSGNKFIQATTSMQILSLLPVLVGFGYFFCFQILLPFGKNKEIFLSMLAGFFAFLVLNFTLVPYFSEVGASIANIVTELVVTISYFLHLRKYHTQKYNWNFAFQSCLSSLLFLPVILLIRYAHFPIIVTLMVSILLCICIYLFFQLIIFKNTFLLDFITPIKNKFWLNKSQDSEQIS